MLISFSVENWKCFRDKVTLSMVASRERQHGERLTPNKKYQCRVLPVAALFGGNASGKSNLIKAMSFARSKIIDQDDKAENAVAEPFVLDKHYADRPSCFSFELWLNGVIYAYGFKVQENRVVEERLSQLNQRGELLLYHIQKNQMVAGQLKELKTPFFAFALTGKKEYQLFLQNVMSQNVQRQPVDDKLKNIFQLIYDWFRKQLVILYPDSHFQLLGKVLGGETKQFRRLEKLFAKLDTGVRQLRMEEFHEHGMKAELVNLLKDKLPQGEAVIVEEGNVGGGASKKQYVISRDKEADSVSVKKLFAVHGQGDEVLFEFREESDGTRRLLDLLPAFLRATDQGSRITLMIDELDRSLHTLLTHRLLDFFLSGCGEYYQSQLIFTTHDVMLMDQRLLRRDEMWALERDNDGVSELFSFADFKNLRDDTDIRKNYLQERMGGVPFIPDLDLSFSSEDVA